MKLYIAGPWVRRGDVIKIAKRFEEAGHKITSRWFHHEGNPNDSTGITATTEHITKQAVEDLEDILSSDFVVILNLEKSEGKAVETGFALAHGIPFITVGDRKNIFAVLGEAELDTVEEALEFLERY